MTQDSPSIAVDKRQAPHSTSEVDWREIRHLPWFLLAPILTLASAFGYLSAFLHETGFLNYYGLPAELIRLDWTTILLAVAAVLLLTSLVGWNFVLLTVRSAGKRGRLVSVLVFAETSVVPVLLYASIRGYFQTLTGRYALLITIFLVLLEFLPGLFLLGGSSRNRKASENKPSKPRHSRLSAFAELLAFSVVFFCMVAYQGGWTDASFQRDYFAPSTKPDSVVLRIYGDNLICAPLADNTTIERAFSALKINEPGLVLTSGRFTNHLPLAR